MRINGYRFMKICKQYMLSVLHGNIMYNGMYLKWNFNNHDYVLVM